MATAQVPISIPIVGTAKAEHPLGPLTADEISASSALIKSVWPPQTSLQFKAITLLEPPKAELLPYLTAEHASQALPFLSRKSFVVYYIRNTVSQILLCRLGQAMLTLAK